MSVRISVKQSQQPFWLTTREVPQVRRVFGQTFQKRLDERFIGKQRFEGLRFLGRKLSKPTLNSRVCNFRIGQKRRIRDAFSEMSRHLHLQMQQA